MMLPLGLLTVASAIAGYAIYAREGKPLGLLVLFTLHVLLRRWHFRDFFLLVLLAVNLSHVRNAWFHDEFSRDKWLALCALGVISLLLAVIFRPRPALAHFLTAIFVGLCCYSIVGSIRPMLSFQKTGAFVIGLTVAFVGAWSIAKSLDDVRGVMDAVVDSLWVVFPASLFLLPSGAYYEAGRFRSYFDNANNLGAWVSMSGPLLFGLALEHPSRTRRWICWGMLAAALICGFAAGSRGGMGGAFIGISFYAFMRWPKRVASLGMLAGIVLFFTSAYEVDVTEVSEASAHLVREESLTTGGNRADTWRLAFLLGQERALRGHGFGVGHAVFGHYGVPKAPGHAEAVQFSTYVTVFTDLGYPGFVTIIGMLAILLLQGWRVWLKDKWGERGLLCLNLVAVVLAVSAHAVVETILVSFGSPWCLPFWTCVALMCRVAQMPPTPVSTEETVEEVPAVVAKRGPRALGAT